MKAALVQYSPEWENKENNIIRINEMLNEHLDDEDIIVFPEMTLTGFTMHSDQFAEEIDGVGLAYFIDLAKRTKKHVFTGIIEKDEDKIYNTLYHLDDKGIITAKYRKIHPFSYAKEDKFFQAGDEPLVTKVGKTTVGLSICYDLRFPELYRQYAKQGAEVMINIANWPVKRIEHWKLLLRARSVDNLAFMIGVNRVGSDPYNEYNGNSAVFSPMGEELALKQDDETVITVEFDTSEADAVRNELHFLDDIKLL